MPSQRSLTVAPLGRASSSAVLSGRMSSSAMAADRKSVALSRRSRAGAGRRFSDAFAAGGVGAIRSETTAAQVLT
jgi:hypothetical protein